MLTADLSASDTTMHVPSAAPPELQGAEFRIQVDNEYVLVTAGQDTNTWTIVRGIEQEWGGDPPTAHGHGTIIEHNFTAGAVGGQTDPDPGQAGLRSLTAMDDRYTTQSTTDVFGRSRIQAPGDLRDVVSVLDDPWFTPNNDSGSADVNISDCIADMSAGGGGVVLVPAGTYRLTNGIVADDNVELHLAKGAYLHKQFSNAGTQNPLIKQVSYLADGTGLTGFTLSGHGKMGAGDYTHAGDMVYLYGTDLKLNDFTIDTWGGTDGTNTGGAAVRIGGIRVRINFVKALNPYLHTGVAGIRVIGGRNVIATGCHITSGDDSLQFVPSAGSTDPLKDLSIRRSAFIGCTGWSCAARFMIVALIVQGVGSGLTASITDVSFIGCHGAGTTRRLLIQNESSSGTIRNVTVTGSVDAFPLLGKVNNGGGISAGAASVTVDETTRFERETGQPPPLPTFPFKIRIGANGGAEDITVTSRTFVSGNLWTYAFSGTAVASHPLGSAVASIDPAITQAGLAEVMIDGRQDAGTNGTIVNIDIQCRVVNPFYACFEIPVPTAPQVQSVSNVKLNMDCALALLDPTVNQMKINTASVVEIKGSFEPQPNAGSDVILVGQGTDPISYVNNLTVQAHFKGISGTGTNALNLNQVRGAVTLGSVYTLTTGAAKAVRVGAVSLGVVAAANDVSSFGTASPWSVISPASITTVGNIGLADRTGPEWEASDHGLITWAFDPSTAQQTSTPLATAGLLYVVKLHVPAAQPVTNIVASVLTAGVGLTAGQCFATLYQFGAKLGITADQAAAWASTGNKTMPIAGGPVNVAAGDVYVTFHFNGTTGPAFSRGAGIAFVNIGLNTTVARYGTADTTITTTPPATLGTVSSLSIAYWAALS